MQSGTRERGGCEVTPTARSLKRLRDLGYVDVIHGERDLAWSFAVVGFKA